MKHGYAAFTKAEIVPFPDDETSRDALSKGEVGAIIAATPIPNFMMLAEPDRYAIGSEALFSSSEAVAVRPDSLRFVNFTTSKETRWHRGSRTLSAMLVACQTQT